MLNDILYLLRFFIRFFVIGIALIVAILWLIVQISDTALFPTIIGATPITLVVWAFWPKQPH